MAQVQQVNSAIAAVIGSAIVADSSWISLTLGYLAQVKQQISDMAVNGSGIRDTARVLKISPTTVIEELKKKNEILNQ